MLEGLQYPFRTTGYLNLRPSLQHCQSVPASRGDAWLRASILSLGQAIWNGVLGISPHERAECSRARNPENVDRASGAFSDSLSRKQLPESGEVPASSKEEPSTADRSSF